MPEVDESMCHEQWMRRSEQAVERSWLRALSQRDRDAADADPRGPDLRAAEPAEARREPVGAVEA
jgi:hypothetical protein